LGFKRPAITTDEAESSLKKTLMLGQV